MNTLYFVYNSCAYLLVAVISAVYLKGRKILTIIYGVWAFSALTTIFFIENADQQVLHVTVHGLPFVYLFFCLSLLTWPLAFLKTNKLNYNTLAIGNKRLSFLDDIIRILAFFLFVPTIENLVLAATIDTDTLGAIYNRDDTGIDVYHRLSFYSRNANRLINLVFYVAPFLLFRELTKTKMDKINLICTGIILMDVILTAYNVAARTEFVKIGICLLFYYFFFKHKMPPKRLKLFNIYALLITILGITALSFITLSRYDAMTSYTNVWGWVSLYTGESFCRFEDMMWYKTDAIMLGDNNFPLIKQLLGLETFTDAIARRTFWEPKIGVPNNIFYTFIGDFVADFGFVIPVIIFFILGCYEYIVVTSMKRNLKYYHIVILSIFIEMLIFGVMHFVYKVYMDQFRLLGTIIFAFVLYRKEKGCKYTSPYISKAVS